MRIFVFEFITGGGLAREHLPVGLAAEGDAMLRALLADLRQIPGLRLRTTRDPRLAPPDADVELVLPGTGDSMLELYAHACANADAVWPIAPETGGTLERLTRIAARLAPCLLGCRAHGVALAASKRRTARALAAAGISTIPTYAAGDSLPADEGRWVVKPDDGVGCEGSLRVTGSRAAARLLSDRMPARHIAQPWIEGEALSLSLLCAAAKAQVLSCNRQHLEIDASGRIRLHHVTPAALPLGAQHHRLAHAVAHAVPGLWGYVGIDFVDSAAGPVVVEINPRLTSAYCGLSRALDMNVAARVLTLAGVIAPMVAWHLPHE